MPERIGAYDVDRLIGAGSFATVWLAHDPVLGGHVAIKVLADNWSHDLRVRERFLEEGRMLWRLDDEHLVRVHGVGEMIDGRPYLVMAWADRGSLQDRLRAGPMTTADGLALLARIADCVAVLHRHEIVHRDLTPANILFRSHADGNERVLVGDLGLAKALAVASGLTGRAGTPGYMAPEQDRSVAVVDARSDVYALGVLGRQILGDGPVTPAVAALLDAAVATDPDDRPTDAAAFADAVRNASAAAVMPVAPAPARAPSRRRRRRLAIVAAACVLVAGAAVALVARRGNDQSGRVWDTTHRVSVLRPTGWKWTGSGWRDRVGPDGRAEPAFVVATDPARWPGDAAVAGAFVGLSPSAVARGETVAGFLSTRVHAGCRPPVSVDERHGGRSWTIVTFAACSDGRAVTEAAAVDAAGLLYVQFSVPSSNSSPSIRVLLDSVTVV